MVISLVSIPAGCLNSFIIAHCFARQFDRRRQAAPQYLQRARDVFTPTPQLDMHMYSRLLSNGHYEPYRTFPDSVYHKALYFPTVTRHMYSHPS